VEIVCRSCKSDDVEKSFRNQWEEKLSMVLPLAPYYCESCDKRFIWLTDPVMDRTRTIFAGVVGGLVLMVLLIVVLTGGEEPVVVEEPVDPLAELGEKYDIPMENEPPTAIENEGDASSETEEAGAGIPPEEEGPPPGSVPEPGEVWSDRVHAQLARNLARSRGEAVAEPTKPAPRRSVTPSPSGSGQISNLRGSDVNGAYAVTLSKGAATIEPKGFAIGTTKYVVDLPGSWQVAGSVKNLNASHPLVTTVRVGRHPAYMRLVFDLAKNARVKVDYTQQDGEFTIRLSE